MKEKRNFKQEIKDFWKEQGSKIKIGVKCLTFGLFIGFIKGVLTSDQMHCKLIDKIPYESDPDNIDDWVSNHMDDLKEYYEFHKNHTEKD